MKYTQLLAKFDFIFENVRVGIVGETGVARDRSCEGQLNFKYTAAVNYLEVGCFFTLNFGNHLNFK